MIVWQGKVWLIGGTSESVAIAHLLTISNIKFVITVATRSALSLYSPDYQITVGCMNETQMQSFCQQQQVKAVVDASHPYAVEVSRQAIAITSKLNLPYLRYERNNYQPSATARSDSCVLKLDSFDTLLAGSYLQQQRVLLTVGCKVLPLFKSWQNQATLFARVLPKITSLQIALGAGFTSTRLITIRPPISVALEKALWQQWNISLVVTKASGKAGGEDLKRQVAKDLNIPLIIIARPLVIYPQQTSAIQQVLKFCRQSLKKHLA